MKLYFKDEFIQAANASEVWFITNGIDAGVPQLIGSAFRDEIVRYFFLKKSHEIFMVFFLKKIVNETSG